ncbi:hypothetical protein [Pseudoalteromonas rubra]|uniref:hypothetical protein n=1 Tax=Pseudoalteromonas rubra TaxID=43658 RepID=UPI000F78BD18|nr:hypothetical protein [Pseudoalteromonas rubra]
MLKKATILACGLAIAPQVIAAPQPIEQLKIAGDVVHITLAQTTNPRTPAACVSPDNASKWTLSLNTASGKASYALLVNAFEKEKQVEIEGTGDCTDHPGVERAYAVSVQQKHGDESVLYLYKGDGVTKLGRILKWETGERWEQLHLVYLNDEYGYHVDSFYPRNYRKLPTVPTYFTEKDCKGTKAFNMQAGRVYFHPDYNDGQLFQVIEGAVTSTSSELHQDGRCLNYRWGHYPSISQTRLVSDRTCGSAPCIIKP